MYDGATDAAEQIAQKVDWLVRSVHGSEAQFDRCRKAGTTLAAVVYAYVEDPEGVGTDALREAYNAFMTQDAGNFGPPLAHVQPA